MLTNNQKEEIAKLRESGSSFAHISDRLNISVGTIKSYCSRNNIFAPASYESKNLCLNCHKPIYQNNKAKRRKFCSDTCRTAWWNSHKNYVHQRESAIYRIPCVNCAVVFKSYGNKHRKYCSKECYFSHRFSPVNSTDTMLKQAK